MKRTFTFFTLFLLLLQISASAQGEWKWANYWSGNGGSVISIFNEIVRTDFDEDGNIYVFGTMGSNPTFNGQTFQFVNNAQVLSHNQRASLLAKFDTLGNMLWYKVVKTSSNGLGLVHWMEVRNGKVYISGNCELGFDGMGLASNSWIYFLDTLVTGAQILSIPENKRRPPFKTGRWTYFATFDLDGNNIDNHFVEARARNIDPNNRGWEYLCNGSGLGVSPFHIDNDGNTYIYTSFGYKGREDDPYTLIVDEDSAKTYNLYLPGTGDNLFATMMYKFSPDWNLVYGRPMVSHTEGIATSLELLGDSVNPIYQVRLMGMSFDEDDNMYISGYVTLGLCGMFGGGDLHQFPIHIHWDGTHYATILDCSSTENMSFVIKYDTTGTVVWNNQLFKRGSCDGDGVDYASGEWNGNYVIDESVFLVGSGCFRTDGLGLVYFDDESHPLQRFQQDPSNINFFVRYNANTGQYISQGIVPANNALLGVAAPAISTNRVFLYSDIFSEKNIYQWDINGNFIDRITISAFDNLLKSLILTSTKGHLLFSTTSNAPISFGNSVSADCTSGQSSAVFALYYDPSFAEPYVGIPQYGENVSNLKIWPNPANSVLNIESDNSSIDQIVITDLNGKMLLQETVGGSHKKINISQLPAGIYLLKAVRNGEASIGKFAKTNN